MDSLSYLEKKLKEIAGLIGVVSSWIFFKSLNRVIFVDSKPGMDIYGSNVYSYILYNKSQVLPFLSLHGRRR